jgi:hypothetical protein
VGLLISGRPDVSFKRTLILGLATAICATAAAATDYYRNVSAWPADSFSTGGYSTSYPMDFDVQEPPSPQTAPGWRWNSDDPGTVLFELTIPRAVESQTNFTGATLTIGSSADLKSVADCVAPNPSADKSWNTKIGGVEFAVFSASDNGMSHYHDITSYRAVHGGKCYAIEYAIASTSLGVYPRSLGLTAFDEPRVKAVLDRIVGTFRLK